MRHFVKMINMYLYLVLSWWLMGIIYSVWFYFQTFILSYLTSGELEGSTGFVLRSQYSKAQDDVGSWPAYTNLYTVFSSKNPDKMDMKYNCN